MKLTEHSCCFDNEDDGNFWRDERLCDSPMRWFYPRTFKDFSRTQRDSPPPLCSPGTSRKADLKKFVQNVVSIFLSE